MHNAPKQEELEAAGWTPMTARGGEILWRRGDPARRVCFVAEGAILVRFHNRIRARVEAGQLLGEASVLAGEEDHGGTAQALTPTRLLVVSRERIAALRESKHPVYVWMLQTACHTLAAHVADLRNRLNQPFECPEVPAGLEPLEAEVRRCLESLLQADADFLARLGPVGNLDTGNPFTTPRDASWDRAGPGHEIELDALPRLRIPQPVAQGKDQLLSTVREGVIGRNEAMWTPFGMRRLVYADYTASGRSLRFVEDFIRDRVMPLYANTHTESSATGLQTTAYREEARRIIAQSVGADGRDAVIFVGSGATGAINKLVELLDLRDDGVERPDEERPVVFVGPYEHHSNLLPWHHSRADLVLVPLDAWGDLDAAALERLLIEYASRPLIIGSFSAASNVTGVATDVQAIARLLHRHGALSFWDYAAAGPYVPIDVNAPDGAHLDAIFLSPHKFVGGPQTPGLLVAKRSIVSRQTPTQPGGGTVDYVTSGAPGMVMSYSAELEHREEAGTPAIIESIRCGLVFRVKELVGPAFIHERESQFVRAAIAAWSDNPSLVVLGNPDAERLSITSFVVRHGEQLLHYNFVIALLNDLFGIQARGGCSCAGPYGTTLLQLDEARGRAFMQCVDTGYNGLKPGWARVNFNYFISDREFEYVVEAVQAVAAYGWALLPRYDFDVASGLWSHRQPPDFRPHRLSDLVHSDGKMRWPTDRHTLLESSLASHLEEGRRVLEEALESVPPQSDPVTYPDGVEANRWFPLPHEVAHWLRRANSQSA